MMKRNVAGEVNLTRMQIHEKESWTEICDALKDMLQLNDKDFNASLKVKGLIICIEKWGFWEFKRRLALKDVGEDYWNMPQGVFWDGLNEKESK